jgi:predicted RNA-binding protein with PIN domain
MSCIGGGTGFGGGLLTGKLSPVTVTYKVFQCRCLTTRTVSRFSVFQTVLSALWFRMALLRVLIDGYSLLHNWPGLARGRARHSLAARDELIRRLTLYQDASGTPISVFFDGAGRPHSRPQAAASPASSGIEVLYSRRDQTADQMIERAVHRFGPYGEVLVITDDYAERDTVISLGGSTASCCSFIQTLENTLAELGEDIQHHNRRERHRFQRCR